MTSSLFSCTSPLALPPFLLLTSLQIVSRFTTPIASEGYWITDANGYELQRRRRDYRATFDLNLTEPQVASWRVNDKDD